MDAEQLHWFWRFLDGFVSNPNRATFKVNEPHRFFDLEIMLKVAPEDEALFTPAVLGALEVILTVRTGITSIKIDLDNSSFFKIRETQSYM
ncbi:MAG: hypothetical protein AAB611_00955 [Patescibacteria group bacterium]